MIPRRFGEPGCTMTAFDARYFCAMLADRFCKHVAYNCVGEQHRQDMMRQALHEKECPFQPALPSRRSYTGRRGLRDNDKGRRYERLWVALIGSRCLPRTYPAEAHALVPYQIQ